MKSLNFLFGKPNLNKSAETGNVEEAKRLIQKGADVNAKDKEGWTALMMATLHGKIEIVKLLIDMGVDVNANDNYGQTALIEAVKWGKKEIVELLLENGADVNMKYGPNGYTALSYVQNTALSVYNYRQDAVKREQIEKLLTAKGAKPKNYESEKKKYQSLPTVIQNCIHFWVVGPEKPCSICGKVESFPPSHGCQNCGLLLCESCYDFICSLTD
jgi:hypothetical protein